MDNKTTYSFEDFENIIARLRAKDGCPWDQVQTHESLRDGMLEEAYEVVEGIDIYQATGDDHNLCEELGDVLLQIVMHARIAEEEGRFTMADVIQGITPVEQGQLMILSPESFIHKKTSPHTQITLS